MCIRDSLYIFPDSVCEQLLPVMRNRYITTEEAISYDNARALEQAFTEQYPELADTGVSYSIRLSTLQVNSTKAGNFVLQAAMLYGAVVLMVICLTVLSLQQMCIRDRPNYENVYPDDITKYMEPISWEAHFGESYCITITGDQTNGYQAVLN